MFGDSKATYHPLYIDTLVEKLVKAIAAALGVNVSIPHYPLFPLVAAGHVCETICKSFGVTPPIFPRRVDWYRQNRAFDICKAKWDLGYRPLVGLTEGLGRTASWYRSEGHLSLPDIASASAR